MAGGSRSYEMAKRLVAKGYNVHMVTSDRELPGFKGWKEENIEGINVHWISVPYDNRMSFFYRVSSFVKFAVCGSIKSMKLQSDLIFATSTPLTIAIPGILASKKTRVPLVFEVRDLWPELPIAIGALKSKPLIWIATKLERIAYANSSYIIGCSPGMCEGVIRHGVDEANVIEIPNSCDLDSFDVGTKKGQQFRAEHPWLRDRPLVVYAGTFGKINGVGYLAKLAVEMKKIDPSVVFLAIGDGLEREAVTEFAKTNGIFEKNMFFLDKQPKKAVPAIYSAASVVMSMFLPIKEMEANSANKFFDGLAAGKPLAINYGGWQAELLKENGNGIVLDYGNVEAAARVLHELLVDEKMLKTMGENSLKLAKKNYSRDLMADRLVGVFDRALMAAKPIDHKE